MKPKKDDKAKSKAAASPGGSRWVIPGTWEKRALSLDAIRKLVDSKEKLVSKQDYNMQMKENSSTVSLSTSRVNYMVGSSGCMR